MSCRPWHTALTDFHPFDIEPQIFSDLANLDGNREWLTEGDGEVDIGDVPGSVYVGVVTDDTIGAVAAQPINSVAAHVHIVFHVKRNARTVLAAKAMLDRVAELMRHTTLFSFIPADNEPAVALARLLGMREVGRLTGAHRRHMERHDMLIFEVQNG